MKITLENTGRKFNKEWVFRNMSLTIDPGEHLSIAGSNGSGKSTLLQLFSGILLPTEGSIFFEVDGKRIDPMEIYQHVSICSPALELMEELFVEEQIELHCKLKPMKSGLRTDDLLEITYLTQQRGKQIRNFSSGMKQRLKLALAILSDTPLLLLDEPISNLDSTAIQWYKELLQKNSDGRTVIVASNRQENETFLCKREISVEEFKPLARK